MTGILRLLKIGCVLLSCYTTAQFIEPMQWAQLHHSPFHWTDYSSCSPSFLSLLGTRAVWDHHFD